MGLFSAKSEARMGAAMASAGVVEAGAIARNVYRFTCLEYEGGPVKWVQEFTNLVTTEGLDDCLTKYFKGAAYTATWFVGLVDNAGFSAFAAGDTAAQIDGSNGWAELQAYTLGTRPALVLGTAAGGSIDNTAALASFTMNSGGTIKGGFVVSSGVKGGTAGTLYGEGAFPTPQPFISGNVILVSVTLTLASA